MANFSVLMSIYSATKANDLDRCLDSLYRQTLPAAEVVIVRDGAIHSDVEQIVAAYEMKLPLHHLCFPYNRGLGPALHDGLEECSHELVARVDSDDRSLAERFQKQTDFLQRNPNISLVGSWLRERYHLSNKNISVVRRCPTTHDSILQVARRRNPINHPTVMFRKTAVLSCNSYEHCPLFEDYYLWAKMLLEGHMMGNLPEPLVETDVDCEYFHRRGGIAYVRNELRLARNLNQIAFLTPIETVIFLISRIPMRLFPVSVRQYLYRIFLRSK